MSAGSPSDNTTFVVDEGDLRKYRTETPNMVLDMGLDPYTGWLYTHIKRIAGDRGVCDGGTSYLAKVARMSRGQVSKSKGILEKRGLIRVKTHPPQSGLADEIYVSNIWRGNFEHFDGPQRSRPETRSPDEQGDACEPSPRLARPAGRASSAPQSGGGPNGAQIARTCEEITQGPLESCLAALPSSPSLRERLAKSAGSPAALTTTLSQLLREAERGDITLDSSARGVIRGSIEQLADPVHLTNTPPVHVVNTAKTACSCGERPCSCGERKKEPLSSLGETRPNGRAKKPRASFPRRRIAKLTDEEAERRWEELCGEDPHGGSLRRLASLLAAENAGGEVAITRVWNELGDRYLRTRERVELPEAAWAYGFERAIARPAPNIGWVVKAARSYEPGGGPKVGAGSPAGCRARSDADYDEAGY